MAHSKLFFMRIWALVSLVRWCIFRRCVFPVAFSQSSLGWPLRDLTGVWLIFGCIGHWWWLQGSSMVQGWPLICESESMASSTPPPFCHAFTDSLFLYFIII